ncbi:class I SAM-dependent methyltransferase [Amycolatopsis australiensis]|uniref:Methyltransferase domain-containing protein n=1 Tax=Amycolatopsis australiensis TaxID=546364 RepID=A0A1K1SKB4_9PSEU|nr:methyltransferase domain-containing protein [Amycolatopsis australiensis]SFW84777.1 Methyltransferase domain-containing protein [Amycolatopsis australiensis]
MKESDFAAHLTATMTGSALTMLIGIGHRTGLFQAAARGPATSAGLAERAGLHERYVREWLGAMVTGGIFTYEAGEYTFPTEHAKFLLGDTASNLMPSLLTLSAFTAILPDLERAFAEGGGVPRSAYGPHLESLGAKTGDSWKHIYREHLVDGFFGAVPGLTERLAAGVRVLDLGCGTGHAISVAARAFPASRFTGIDIDRRVVDLARQNAGDLPNAEFAVGDAAALTADPPYDLITAFDAVHDQDRPDVVLRQVRRALAPDGLFFMVDTFFSSDVARNVGNPLAALTYSISLMYCTTTSLAEGGAALGAMWGTEKATEMLTDAGFGHVRVAASPRPQNCIYVCRP